MSKQREDDAAIPNPKRPISVREGVPLPMSKRAMSKKPGLDDTCGGTKLKIQNKDIVSDAALRDLYQRWMLFYKIDRDEDEQEERFLVFKQRVTSIHKFNNEKHTWTKGLNEWSDSHGEEIERILFCKMESSSDSE